MLKKASLPGLILAAAFGCGVSSALADSVPDQTGDAGMDSTTGTTSSSTSTYSSTTTGRSGATVMTLDTDGDTYISVKEADSDPSLKAKFRTLDKNSDGRLDKGEFSAFEVDVDSDSNVDSDADTNLGPEPGDQGEPGVMGTDDSTPGNTDELGPGR